MGRPPVEKPDNWEEIKAAWKSGHMTAQQAMQQVGLRKTSFYKLVKTKQ